MSVVGPSKEAHLEVSIEELGGFLQDGYCTLFFSSHRQLDVWFGSERVVQKEIFDQTGENCCGIFHRDRVAVDSLGTAFSSYRSHHAPAERRK